MAFAILPLFAFANAGLSFAGLDADDFLQPVTLGIVGGLLLGKPVGIVAFVGLAVALRLASLPPGVTWAQIAGVGCACGIGFTMSLNKAGGPDVARHAATAAGDGEGMRVDGYRRTKM